MHGNYGRSASHPQYLVLTPERIQERNLDTFGFLNRSLIDYEKYHQYVGHAGVQYSIAVQATRGCPYRCFYCDIYKTTKHHFRRSDEHLFVEIDLLYECGVRRIEFIDDIFNVNTKGFRRFFEYVIAREYDIQFFFPTGLKGDLLDFELIDLMVAGGAVGINLSLEHASPRMQTVMRKGLDVDKLHENLQYITANYPQVILTLNAMHGFPSETEGEARETLEYIKSIKWIDFPYLHNVRIFPGTEIEHFALEVGIPQELIDASQDMSYHEHSPTLPFREEFTNEVKADFLKNYVFDKNRLTERLRRQLEVFSEEELNQKYNAYFPNKRIRGVKDIIDIFGLNKKAIYPETAFDINSVMPKNFTEIFTETYQRYKEVGILNLKTEVRLLFLDASTYFESSGNLREYNVLEPPLGLMALGTYLERRIGSGLTLKLCKSKIDFNSFDELRNLVSTFKPTLIGIRAMTFYKAFFHEICDHLKAWDPNIPIIAGGPYPTASYPDLVMDRNLDVVCVGEGETTLFDVILAMADNDGQWLSKDQLLSIPGLAFYDEQIQTLRIYNPEDWKKTGAGPAG